MANYELVEDAIVVEFLDGKHRYVYDRCRPGAIHLEAMLRLAAQGKGLTTYISQHVRENYARKVKLTRERV